MSRPTVLDLFCCAGGAARGYQRAGFRVYGVDKVSRPNYCGDSMAVEDALVVLQELVRERRLGIWGRPDLIHMSPPCQAGCTLTNGTNAANGWGREHEQLVPAVRELALKTGIPFVIEQPQGHKGLIRTDLRLCMDMFRPAHMPPPWVQRHRDFELNGWEIRLKPQHVKHDGYVRGLRHGVWRDGPYVAAYGSGGGKATVAEMQHALGIDWTDVREELTEAIPPAYTEWIGREFLRRQWVPE